MRTATRPVVLPGLALALTLGLAACGPDFDPSQFGPGAEDLTTLEQGLTQVTSFGSNPGGLKMYTYVPSSMPDNAPLVLALHGCTQSASDYANAGWNQLADQWKFYVVYPETTSGVRCFLWYDLANNKRGQGEALSIKQMVDYMAAHYDVDASRIFVTGLSAGGAMTVTMLSAYPDVFAAGAPMAGLPYRCADTMGDSGVCMGSGKVQSPQTWGDLVRGAFPGYAGPWPRVSIWQGASDYTVSTANSAELMKQWTNVKGIDQTSDASGQVDTAAHAEYHDAAGNTLVETWMVSGMGHAVAVKPGFQPANGCGQAGNFVSSAGICSSYYAARFFGLDPSSPVEQGGSDAGTIDPPPAGEDAGTTPEPGPDASTPVVEPCTEWNTNNYEHVQAGRAEQCGDYNSYVCTVGSGENLGLYSLGISSWVREVSPGYFEAGRCADRPVTPPAGEDAGVPAGEDASVEPPPAGEDASVEPPPAGEDASVEPPPAGEDASTPVEPGPDASVEPPPAGEDAATPVEPGPDASVEPPPAGEDAATPAVEDGPDASEPGQLDLSKDGGTSPRQPDAGETRDPEAEFWGCGTSGPAAPWFAPLALLLVSRRRRRNAQP